MDEFLATRPVTQSLNLIFTTRDVPKNEDTLRRLKQHLQRTIRNVYGSDEKTADIRAMQEKRIQIEGETLDLCLLPTVKRCATRLVARGKPIHVIVLNAGIGGWSGLNWPLAIWTATINPLEATLFPCYKLSYVGRTCKPQIESSKGSKEPPLGEVFTANVFGHYMLTHWLRPVLQPTKADGSPARIIWISSIESLSHSFDSNDIQGLLSDAAYDSSKRLTEILALTSVLPSTQKSIETFLPGRPTRPNQYVAHPGCALTTIASIPVIMTYLQILTFYIVRLIGSPWHPIWPYKAAVSAVWLALASQTTLDEVEADGGKGKWGAATDRLGEERVVRTEVSGWGWSGRHDEVSDKTWKLRARWWRPEVVRGPESTEEFEKLGAKVWGEMEELRMEWEKILKDV